MRKLIVIEFILTSLLIVALSLPGMFQGHPAPGIFILPILFLLLAITSVTTVVSGKKLSKLIGAEEFKTNKEAYYCYKGNIILLAILSLWIIFGIIANNA